MNWTRRLTLTWLLAALLLASTTAHGQTVTPIPSAPLTVPLELCESEIDKLADESEAELSRQSAAFVITLRETAATMQTTCDAAVTSAVATERRDTEPRLAAREAEALRLYSEAQAWQTVALIGIPVAVGVGILVGLLID